MTVNRNTVPFDPNGPWYTSGIRLGTAALTTLGLKGDEMMKIADLIVELLANTRPATINGKASKAKVEIDEKVLEKVRAEVTELLSSFPLYPELSVTEMTHAIG